MTGRVGATGKGEVGSGVVGHGWLSGVCIDRVAMG